MANGATLDLSFVLVDERPLLFGMALVADRVIAVSTAKLVGQETAMRVVAIRALNQAFIDPVMKGSCELRAHIQVTAVTQLRCRLFQQKLAFFCVVGIVAIDARNPALQVRRPPIIVVLRTVLVAIEATRTDLCRRSVLKGENLALVAAAIHMGLAWSVAGLATLPLRPPMSCKLRRHGGRKMRRLFEVGSDFVVTSFTGIRSHVQCGIGWPHVVCLACRSLCLGRFFIASMSQGNENERQRG